LDGLLIDDRLVDRMQPTDAGETFNGGDLAIHGLHPADRNTVERGRRPTTKHAPHRPTPAKPALTALDQWTQSLSPPLAPYRACPHVAGPAS
jgi:hypothetical protein